MLSVCFLLEIRFCTPTSQAINCALQNLLLSVRLFVFCLFARKQKSQFLGNKAGILFFFFIHNTVSVDTNPTLSFPARTTDRAAAVSAKKRRSLLLGQVISRFPQRFPRRRLPPVRRGGRHRMNHQGLFALARGSCARGMGFPFLDVSLGRLPWKAAARGARRWPGKDALSR